MQNKYISKLDKILVAGANGMVGSLKSIFQKALQEQLRTMKMRD